MIPPKDPLPPPEPTRNSPSGLTKILPTYDVNGKVTYGPKPAPHLVEALPFELYPLPTESSSPSPLFAPVIEELPTLNAALSASALDNFAHSLDKHDPRIRAKLDQPFGKDTLERFLVTEPTLRHVLLPLWKSGFLYAANPSWQALSQAYPPARTLLAPLFRVQGRLSHVYPRLNLINLMNLMNPKDNRQQQLLHLSNSLTRLR